MIHRETAQYPSPPLVAWLSQSGSSNSLGTRHLSPLSHPGILLTHPWGEENAFVCPKHEQLCQAQCGLFLARHHRHRPVLSRLHNLTSSGCCSCNPLLSCHPLWQLQGLYAEDTFYAVHCPAIPPYYLKSLKVVQVALGQLSSEGTVYHPMSSKFLLRLASALHCSKLGEPVVPQ